MLGRVAVMVGVLALAIAPSAGAKGPVAEGSDGPDPRGITMSGTGLARVTPPGRLSDETIRRAVDEARPTAVSRAINESRDRATAVAQAAGLTLGDVVAVEDQVEGAALIGPFGGDRFCRRPRRRSARPRCEVPKFVAALVSVTYSTLETDAAPLPERTIAATGSDDADVDPSRRTSRSIRRAILDADIDAIPGAVAAARQEAAALARSTGMLLGPIVSVAPPSTSPFGDPFFEAGIFGPFGVGEFCGTITRPVFRRDPQTGRRRVVRRVRQRRCFFPRSITTSLRVTFDGAG